jgi:glycine/D-amino acid oxidase-like deaminating enzyme
MTIRYASDLSRTADLVVIGGGIVGTATAFHGSRAGLDVVVLERKPQLCALTTAAAAGGFRLQLDNEDEYRLISESVDLYLHFEEATGQRRYDASVQQQGYLWATTSEEGVARQRDLVARQRSWGLGDVELLSGDEARTRFPFLDPAVRQVRFRAGDGLIDPKAVTFGFAEGSEATFVTRCAVDEVRAAAAGSVSVRTSLGDLDAGAVVIAAGPFSGVVAGTAGVPLPVTTVRRQKLVLPDVPAVPAGAPMTIDDDTGAHWRPAFGGAFVLFTDPATPPSEPADVVPVDDRFAFDVLDPTSPHAVARVAGFWREVWERGDQHWMLQAGQYTMTPDRRPLIGETTTPGVFVNTGYSGHGVMGAPAGSRHLVDLITGKADRAVNPFTPDRAFLERPRGDHL